MEMLDTFGIVLAASILFLMIVSAAGGFLIARKALQPIEEISGAIDRISERNLSERIDDKNIPSELKVIASSFNRAFAGIEGAFNRQRQFVGDASHELKTPLAVILAGAEVALRRERNADAYKTALAGIVDAARMMSLIIEKLLQLARLNSEPFSLRMEATQLDEMIDKSLKLLGPVAQKKGISFQWSDSGYVVCGDGEALQEAFLNIIENAIKYNVPGGRIDVAAKKEGGLIVVEIADTGIGIPEGDLEKIFDRFYRVDKSRSRESGGAGLGLSIVREIVRLHGGRVEIKSHVGAGTAVSVFLPEGHSA
jgi:heavy metal sensor kinase